MPAISDKWKDIRLGWVLRLLQLGELGTIKGSREAFDVDEATFSREITALEKCLGFSLTERVNHQSQLTKQGKRFASNFVPVIEFMGRMERNMAASTRPYQLRFGAGGSIVAWLLSSRLQDIKKKVLRNINPDQVKFDFQPYKNREMVRLIAAGALDCAIVRSGVATDSRLPIRQEKVGMVGYYLYVPRKWVPEEYWTGYQDRHLPIERDILSNYPIATVGPDGECRTRLDSAIRDAEIDADIEFSYRSFPMLLSHMLRGSHVTIMPSLTQFEVMGRDELDYLCFPLKLLQGYNRKLCLIMHKDHEERTPWIDFHALLQAVKFTK